MEKPRGEKERKFFSSHAMRFTARDHSKPVDMTNPFIAAAAQQREDAGCEERIAVCEAHVCSEPAGSDEPFSPTTVKRTPSWWTPFGSVNRTKSGGVLSRKNTLVSDWTLSRSRDRTNLSIC